MATKTKTHHMNGCPTGVKNAALGGSERCSTDQWGRVDCNHCLKKAPPAEPTCEEQAAAVDKLLVDDSVGNEPSGDAGPPPRETTETEVVAPVALAETVEPAYVGPKTKFSGSSADRRKQRRALKRQGLAA